MVYIHPFFELSVCRRGPEWSKAPSSFFAYAHAIVLVRAQPRRTATCHTRCRSNVALGTGCSTFTCTVLTDSGRSNVYQMSSCSPLGGGKGKNGDGEKIGATVTLPAYRKVAGVDASNSLRHLEVMGLPSHFFPKAFPSDPDTMTNTALEAIASSSSNKCYRSMLGVSQREHRTNDWTVL